MNADSKLVSKVDLLPEFCNAPRNQPISKITIHHMAGVLSHAQFVSVAKQREESAQYDIDKDALVGQTCLEANRAWTSSSSWNDNRAVTIEVSNSEVNDEWPVSDKVYNKLIDLCVDICQRNNIPKLEYTGTKEGSLTTHDMFTKTACPGPYLKSRMKNIAAAVNKRLQSTEEIKMEPVKEASKPTPKKTIDQVAQDVIKGLYGNGDERKTKLEKEGYNYSEVQAKVNELLAPKPKKTIDQVAQDVIKGLYGNGAERKNKLNAEGYRYDEVQAKVNEILAANNNTANAKATKLAVAHSYEPTKYSGLYMVVPANANVRLVPGNMSNAAIATTVCTKTKVRCYGYYERVGNSIWLLVQAGAVTGFMDISVLRRI